MENTTHAQKAVKIQLNCERTSKNRRKLDEYLKRVNNNTTNNAKSDSGEPARHRG